MVERDESVMCYCEKCFGDFPVEDLIWMWQVSDGLLPDRYEGCCVECLDKEMRLVDAQCDE